MTAAALAAACVALSADAAAPPAPDPVLTPIRLAPHGWMVQGACWSGGRRCW